MRAHARDGVDTTTPPPWCVCVVLLVGLKMVCLCCTVGGAEDGVFVLFCWWG